MSFLRKILYILSSVLALVLLLANLPSFAAFEAHKINVTATICGYSETRTIGFWKNHPEIYTHYLPQDLGDETIDTWEKADEIFQNANAVQMRDMLKAQLLAMKFNIAYFGIGEYLVESEDRTLNQIVNEADGLLRQVPEPPRNILEEMKNLLEELNDLEKIRYCRIQLPDYGSYLVVNKVYYDVDSNHGSESYNEWIEIYNPSENKINLKGWQVCDNKVCVSLTFDNLYLSGGGFAVVSRSQTTWQYWDIPDDVLKIVPENPSSFYLANSGDRVILKNSRGVEVDAMSYGDDNYVFDPPCPDIHEGHILGRNPNGFDTDTAFDWEDFGLPEISNVSIYQNGKLVPPDGALYGNRPAEIQWQATNSNGSDSELSIDLTYIMDTNKNESLDENDETYVIADDIENTGSYNWVVYPFYGYVWVKVTAQGPENFMINKALVSYRVFEPSTEEEVSDDTTDITTDEIIEDTVDEIIENSVEDTIDNVTEETTDEIINEAPEETVETTETNETTTDAPTDSTVDEVTSTDGEILLDDTLTETITD